MDKVRKLKQVFLEVEKKIKIFTKKGKKFLMRSI